MSPADPPLRDEPESWPVRSSVDLHRDHWVVALRRDEVVDPTGTTMSRLVLEHPGAVIVLAVDEQERVFCLRQYRHVTGRRFVELPAGLLDGPAAEDPLEAARRELREEAQLEAVSWTHLLTTYPSPGISDEQQVFYLATGLSATDRGGFAPEHEELDMDGGWVPLADLLEAVLDGRVQDGPVVQAVLCYAYTHRSRPDAGR
ncbi:MAG TPA: NUDIX hydrolase [Nocardioidaceae bacterium]|nr:NUDIX hydrolase [Nocardioidaceae bacterium]